MNRKIVKKVEYRRNSGNDVFKFETSQTLPTPSDQSIRSSVPTIIGLSASERWNWTLRISQGTGKLARAPKLSKTKMIGKNF